MNFIEGRVEDREEGQVFVGADVVIALTQPDPAWSRTTSAGVRPQDLTLSQGGGICQGRVDVVEPMGPETFVYVSVGAATLVARVGPAVRVHVGDTVHLSVDPARVHLFDAAGQSLTRHALTTEAP